MWTYFILSELMNFVISTGFFSKREKFYFQMAVLFTLLGSHWQPCN